MPKYTIETISTDSMQSKSFTMHTNSEYEKIAIIVILAGCGVAIALAFAVLICCQFLVKVNQLYF